MDEFKIKSIDDLKNKAFFYAVSMILFSIVNRSIDLGEEIVSNKNLGLPERYQDIFKLLERNNIINKKIMNVFSELIHFRNLAAHEYQTFKEEDVLKAYNKISYVKIFVEMIKKAI